LTVEVHGKLGREFFPLEKGPKKKTKKTAKKRTAQLTREKVNLAEGRRGLTTGKGKKTCYVKRGIQLT